MVKLVSAAKNGKTSICRKKTVKLVSAQKMVKLVSATKNGKTSICRKKW